MENDMNGLEITPCEDSDFQQDKYTKLKLNSSQKTQMFGLLQQLPSILGADTQADAFEFKKPADMSLANVLQNLINVGAGVLSENGTGPLAAIVSNGAQMAMMNAFSIMSVASAQYYLSEINNNLTAISQKADKILEFLYGDKKAELTSEVRFVDFAFKNYATIMSNDAQRFATLTNVQEARKVAMKDMEFYISDLESLAKTKDISNLDSFVNDVFKIKDCLQLAIQLYCMSNILEVCYSQNTDSSYLKYVENDIFSYIDKCEKRMLSDFSAVQMRVSNYKGGPLKKVDKTDYEKQISQFVDLLGSGEELIKRKPLKSILRSYEKDATYYLNKAGELFLKTA